LVPHVKGHYRNGRQVRPHFRHAPSQGAGIGAIIFLILVILIIAKLNGA
jgi:hypothetical protein